MFGPDVSSELSRHHHLRRQLDNRRGALAGLAFEAKFTAVTRDDGGDHGQPKACAFRRARSVIQPHERRQYAFRVRRRHAGAAVSDGYRQAAILRLSGPDLDAAAEFAE